MMRYVNEHKTAEYEWFLRLDDDAYVHIEHLESLLRRIDSDQMLYIGSPGFGRDDDDFIEDNMVYCMGGPGIVVSKEGCFFGQAQKIAKQPELKTGFCHYCPLDINFGG